MRGSIVGTEPLNSSLREFPTNDNKNRESTAKIIGSSVFGGLFFVIFLCPFGVLREREQVHN